MMMKIKYFLVFIFLGVLVSTNSLIGQNYNTKKKAPTKESSKFTEKLWYGGGVNLGFGADEYTSVFSLGLSPMVGYKFTPDFSMGPRVGFSFSNYRFKNQSKIDKIATFDLAGGVFARYKFFNVVFAHVEFDLTRNQYAYYNNLTRQLEKISQNGQDAFVGLGYNSGMGSFGTELYILYNLIADQNTISQPFEFRFGITYKI